MIKDFEPSVITWFSAHFKWRYREGTMPRKVILREVSEDTSTLIHYRGQKRKCKVVGLSPNTFYTFQLQQDPGDESLAVRFRTVKCGKHDARLIAAIEDHNLIEAKKICTASPEVINIPDKTGLSPMMYAAQRGFPSVIRILEEYGGNVDYSNPGGKTALMLGAYHGHSHVISSLMELGADWRRLDNAGCTALHYSIEQGNVDICKALVDQGADVNMPDIRGYNGIISACLADREDVDIVMFLLEHGADPDSFSPSGETCVIAATRTNKTQILELLIEYQADHQKKTKYGFTALDMTTEDSRTYEILERYFLESRSEGTELYK